MAFVKGLDVSVFDPVINWAKIRAQGFRFVIIRSVRHNGAARAPIKPPVPKPGCTSATGSNI